MKISKNVLTMKQHFENNMKIILTNTKRVLKQILDKYHVSLKWNSHPFVNFQFLDIRWSSSPAVKIFSFWFFWYKVLLKWSVTPSWNFVMTNEILVTATRNTKAYTKHAQRKQVPWLTMHNVIKNAGCAMCIAHFHI